MAAAFYSHDSLMAVVCKGNENPQGQSSEASLKGKAFLTFSVTETLY